MDRNLEIQRLKKSVADAKQLREELKGRIFDLNKLLKKAEALKSKAERSLRNSH
jgi:hypothetical protein